MHELVLECKFITWDINYIYMHSYSLLHSIVFADMVVTATEAVQ